jgi:hypothetical protein
MDISRVNGELSAKLENQSEVHAVRQAALIYRADLNLIARKRRIGRDLLALSVKASEAGADMIRADRSASTTGSGLYVSPLELDPSETSLSRSALAWASEHPRPFSTPNAQAFMRELLSHLDNEIAQP